MSAEPRVSVVIPCLNEGQTIGWCLDSILASDYSQEQLEIIVADGGSTDGTREIVQAYASRSPCIRLVDNPRRSIPTGLNAGIRAASGDVIARMDAHSSCEPGYLRACVGYLRTTEADSVGGRIVTVGRADSRVGRAIAAAMATPFGVGSSMFRVAQGGEPVWAESVPFACYRRSVFDRVGLFNELLLRSEDVEHQQRMRAAGCRTLLVPALLSYYYARSNLRSVIRHAYDNGRWAILPTRYTRSVVVSLRHLVPLFFVAALVSLSLLAIRLPTAGYLLAAMLGVYGMASIVSSVAVAWRRREPALLVFLPVVFVVLHVSYGLGSLVALPEVAWHRIVPAPETPAVM